jgi:hypothetical protein
LATGACFSGATSSETSRPVASAASVRFGVIVEHPLYFE